MSATTYTTKAGDVLDLICWQFYGSVSGGQVEAVLAANMGLAANGPILPAGLQITLPDVTPTQKPTLSILG